MKKITSSLIALTVSGTAMAHPGHDHSHFLSGAIHAVTALAVVAAIVAVAHAIINRKKSAQPLKN